MLTIKTILHPTDFSPASDNAFRMAAALAHDYGARLIALHVADPPVIVFGEGVVPPEPAKHREAIQYRLDEMQAHAPHVAVERELAEGNPVAEILRVAEEHACDVIVMGTHGRKGLGRLLLGSVAEQVLRHAQCTVLTVKGPVRASQPVASPELVGVS
jgi:nucleotide-binding universal stress UspA family protein